MQTASDLRAELQWTLEEVRGGRRSPLTRPARIAVPAIAVLAGAIWALWPAPKPALTEPSLGPLTAFHGDEAYPTFSPDGGQVAFAWNGENRDNADIYIKRLDADTPLRLTTDTADDIAPAWSPDGSRIAFIRGRGDQASIYLTAPVPGAERKLVDYTPSSLGYPAFSTRNHSISWAPDSESIVVAGRIAGERPNAVLAIPIAGGEPRVVLSRTVDEGDFRFPSISPEGSSLAYAFCRGEGCDVYVIPIDSNMVPSGEPKRLTRQPGASVWGVSWTADGGSLVYGSWLGTLNLWRVSITRPGTQAPGTRARRPQTGRRSDGQSARIRASGRGFGHLEVRSRRRADSSRLVQPVGYRRGALARRQAHRSGERAFRGRP